MDGSSDKSTIEQFAALLLRHGVEFILIGGQAEALHGSTRVTYDIDVCYRRTSENLVRLANALREMKVTLRNAPPDLPFLIDAKTLELGCNFTFNSEFEAVDFLGLVEPIGTYEDLAKNAEEYDVDGLLIKAISLDDLIKVKQHINRAKDRESLIHLKSLREKRDRDGSL